jgi:xanthine dehydrogenase YagT iron-sulfur-binding subunit
MKRLAAKHRRAIDAEMSLRDAARRRFLIETGAIASAMAASPWLDAAGPLDSVAAPRSVVRDPAKVSVTLEVNGQRYPLVLDPRVTLLDALREHLQLTGTKKGCDRGQCGACTVLVDGRRINACLTLAAAAAGSRVTTIEGLASGTALHPVQQAFLDRDAFQCGYCTPGQICSAVALLSEARAGAPSAVTSDLRSRGPVELTDVEIRERMSGNVCRCGAYVNIVAAVRDAGRRSG